MRIALAPGMLGAAYSNSKLGFTILLGVALITDALDGFLARRWRAESRVGRRLDYWGDAITMSLGALGLFFLWPEPVEQEWIWVLVAVAGYMALGVDRLWRRPDQMKPPAWWRRILSLALPLSLIPLILGWSPWAFRVASVLQVLLAVSKISEPKEVSPADFKARHLAEVQDSNPG